MSVVGGKADPLAYLAKRLSLAIFRHPSIPVQAFE
jgi:hypothetical protein